MKIKTAYIIEILVSCFAICVNRLDTVGACQAFSMGY